MRAVVQRVRRAEVEVEGEVVGAIGRGLLVLACAMDGDGDADVAWLADKLPALRVFPNEQGRMDLCLSQLPAAEQGLLLVSQFTLAADLGPGVSKGNRPAFTSAMAPAAASACVDKLAASLRTRLPAGAVRMGVFGADMKVTLENDGPVTLWLDTRRSPRLGEGVDGG